MIRGLHGMIYSKEPEALRAFLRDLIGLPATDVGDGWLIFDLPSVDLGVHPTDGTPPGGTMDLSFFCDDIHGTVRDLEAKGVVFRQPVEDYGYGWVTYIQAPGEVTIQLYEPKYTK